jgi:hypothetical protein
MKQTAITELDDNTTLDPYNFTEVVPSADLAKRDFREIVWPVEPEDSNDVDLGIKDHESW